MRSRKTYLKMEYKPINQFSMQKCMQMSQFPRMSCICIDFFQYFSRNDVLVGCTFYEFLRKGKVSKYEKKLQDLLKGLDGLKSVDRILSQCDYSATIAQVLLSLNSFVAVVALWVNLNKSLL